MVSSYTWIGPTSGGDWSTGADWSPAGPPKSNASVTIGDDTIDLETTATVFNLSLDGNLLVGRFGAGSLTITNATINGDLQARSQGSITLKGQINGNGEIDVSSSFDSNPNVTLDGGTINGFAIDVQSDSGLMVANGVTEVLTQSVLNDMQSQLTIGTNSTLKLNDTSISSEGFAGPIELSSGSALVIDATSNISGAMVGGLHSGGNSIDMRGVYFGALKSEHLTQYGADAVLTLNYAQSSVTLDLLGQFAANFTTSAPPPGYEGFVLSSDHNGAHPGTIITYVHT